MATRDTGGQQKATRSREETDEVEASVDAEGTERREQMSEDVDSILDEIDGVLESNAEEFVRSYVQKGGVDGFVPHLGGSRWQTPSIARTAVSCGRRRSSPGTGRRWTGWRSTADGMHRNGTWPPAGQEKDLLGAVTQSASTYRPGTSGALTAAR
ncbi:ubiquitin-like protein Pup [Klenkia terrae]